MKRYALALLVLAGFGFVWKLLASWLPSGSERFYVLLPPTVGALFLLLVPNARSRLIERRRVFVLYLAVVPAGCILYALYLGTVLAPAPAIPWNRRFSVWEAVVAMYFLASMFLLLTLPLNLFRFLTQTGQTDKANALSTSGISGSWTGVLLRSALEVGLILMMLPVALAALQIHRLKVINPLSPHEMDGRSYEDIAFRTSDGLTLRGWWLPSGTPTSRTLLICHGLSANRTNFYPFVSLGDDLKANVLIFDFRGHGDSDGHSASFGLNEKNDVLAAVDYLRRERPEFCRNLIGLGISMGGASLMRAAGEVDPPFDALVIDSGFASALELTDNVLHAIPGPLRSLFLIPGVPLASLHAGGDLREVRPIDAIDKVRAPILFIHAAGDGLIPVDHSRRLFESAYEPKRMWIADTGGHGSALRDRDGYRRAVEGLLELQQPAR